VMKNYRSVHNPAPDKLGAGATAPRRQSTF
jgi:hypothetical protein